MNMGVDPRRARRVTSGLAALAVALTLVAIGGAARGGSGDGDIHPTGVRLLVDLLLVVFGLVLLAGVGLVALGWINRVRLTVPRQVAVAPMPWWQRLLLAVAHGVVLGVWLSVLIVAGAELLREMGLTPGGLVPPAPVRSSPNDRGGAGIDWPAIVAAIVLVATLGAAWLTSGSKRRAPELDPADDADDPLAAMRSVGLGELAREADPRQAVIRAYAAMAALLDRSGLPREPSETPFEYLDRVLVAFGSSATAAHRLTVLFEQAKFSDHPITPSFKSEAISAVRALRAEVAV